MSNSKSAFCVSAAAMALCALAAFAKQKVVVVNEDNDHYFKLDASLMNEESLKAYIDKMAGGKVTHFFMCPSGQRPSYGSKVWEPIWTGLDEPGGLNQGGYTTEGDFSPEVTLNGVASTGSSPTLMKIRPTGIAHKGVDYTCRRYSFPANAVHGGAGNVVKIGPTPEAKTIIWCEIVLEP